MPACLTLHTTTCQQWPFRLVQIQLCLIYLSSGLLKLSGYTWRNGSALFYVVHRKGTWNIDGVPALSTQQQYACSISDLFGKWLNHSIIFEDLDILHGLTWATVALELLFPVLVWFRRSRLLVLVSITLFHISLHVSMNLNHFHLVMLVGSLCWFLHPESDNPKAKVI